MSDRQLTHEEWNAAELTARMSVRHYPDVDPDEVFQEIWMWVLEHWDKVTLWRTQERGFGKFKKAIRNAARDFCEAQRITDLGGYAEDHVPYSRGLIRRLLPQALEEEWFWPPGRGIETEGRKGDPSAGNEQIVSLIDVRNAFHGAVTEPGQDLLRLAVDLDFDYHELAAHLSDRAVEAGMEGEITAEQARERVGYHLDRMRRFLGGPKPGDSFKEYTGSRRVISSTDAAAIFKRQYGG